MIQFTIPGEPTAWGRARYDRSSRRFFTPTKTRKAEASVGQLAARALNGAAPLTVPVSLLVVATMTIPVSWSKKKQALAAAGALMPLKTPDSDNLLKLVSDGLNKVAYDDDCQVVDARVIKLYGHTPGTYVEVRPVDAVPQF